MIPNNSIFISLPIDFIGANVDEPSDLARGLASFKKDMGAIDIVLGEFEGVSEGVVDMGLGSKVHDGVDGFSN